jgi:hypothetical protein
MHLGFLDHPMKHGEHQDIKNKRCILLGVQVKRTPHAINSSILMEARKELVDELFLRPDGAPKKNYTLKEIVLVLDKYKYLSSHIFEYSKQDYYI